jgi:hypothetical protein
MRPTFWADATVAEVPVHARLTFIGLWGMSDDDGYFEWRPAEIAAELYRYDPAKARVRHVEDHLSKLTEAGLVEALECGRHGLIDSMPKHRTQGGRHTFPTREAHLSTCIAGRVHPRPSASRPYRDVSGSVSDRDVSDSGAPPRAGLSVLDAVALEVGGFAGDHAANRKPA